MIFILGIQCDNAAFEPQPNDEVAAMLREAADDVESGCTRNKLRDTNGYTVGAMEFRELHDPDAFYRLGLDL